jgi:hypothetical protein
MRIIKSIRMRLAGHVARMGPKGNAYRILVGKPGGKRLLGKRRRSLDDNIKMDLREIGWGGTVWIEHGGEPSGPVKCWSILEWLRNWRLLKKDSTPWSWLILALLLLLLLPTNISG